MNIPPTQSYQKDLDRLEQTYKRSLKRLVKLMKNVDPLDVVQFQVYENLLRSIMLVVDDLNKQSRLWVELTLTEAFGYSYASAMVTSGMASSIAEARGKTVLTRVDRHKIDAIINDTFRDVLKATTFMTEELKSEIRQLQAEVIRGNMALQRGTVTTAKEMKEKFITKGFSEKLVTDAWKGIIDASGKRWDLTTYTRMVSSTKIMQASLQGSIDFAREHNSTDLAIISSHGAKDSCRFYEGMIVSLEGLTRGYPTLGEVRGSGLIFHPNCQHRVHPFDRPEALPKEVLQKAQKANETASQAMENPDYYKALDNKRRYEESKK